MSSITVREGKIVLMQHGFFGSEGTFEQFAETKKGMVSNDIVYEEVLSNRAGNVGPISNQTYKTGAQKVASWMNSFDAFYQNSDKEKNIFIRTEFANGTDSVESQRDELKMFIDKIRELGYTRKFHLVGHSKGGLVNTEFTLTYPDEIDKLVSIHTPYGDSSATSLVGDVASMVNGVVETEVIEGLSNITSDDYLSNLRARWNSSSKKNDLYLVGGSAVKITKATLLEIGFEEGKVNFLDVNDEYVTDGVVFLRDQLGESESNPLNLPSSNKKVYTRGEVELTIPQLVDHDLVTVLADKVRDIPIIGGFLGFVADVVDKYIVNSSDLLIGIAAIDFYGAPFHHLSTCDQEETVAYTSLVLYD